MSHSSRPSHQAVRAVSTLGVLGSFAALALLSACASKPQVSAKQETTQYLSRASRTYTPPGPASDPWGPYITKAASKFDVPERWIREVMRQESGGRLYGRNGDLITSNAGAMGLMQVMPGTYHELRARYPELGSDPFDPQNNILAGTAYIREMYDIYGSPGFLAAYNAGPGRLDDYLTRSRILPEETRRYVASIGPKIAGTFPATHSPGEQYAMNALPVQIADGPRYAMNRATAAADPRPSGVPPSGVPIVLNPSVYAANTTPITLNPVAEAAQFPEPPQAVALAPAQSIDPTPARPIVLGPARPIEVAQMPEPPVPAMPQRLQSAEPARQFAALAPPTPPRPAAFSLVSPANAASNATASTSRRTGFSPGNWAVQVGAFENSNLAIAATAAARDSARDVLGSARPAVSSVRQSRGTLYRARLVGLSRDAAAQTCERLARTRTNCMIVSPDAQS